MPLFKIHNNFAKKIRIKQLDLERNLQVLVENNLDEILDIAFLAHEYPTSFGGRIDTLGIDKNGAPCIIEFKRNQNESVINQGLSYLRWLLDHKADFEKLVQKSLNDNVSSPIKTYNAEFTVENIDWDSPRVICIAESYNKFDNDTAEILPITIELLKYRLYEDDILLIEAENHQRIKISLPTSLKSISSEEKKRLQVDYSMEDHLKNANEKIKALFLQLREKITALDEAIKEEPKKLYIAYKLSTNFVDVELRTKDIKVFLNIKSGMLQDEKHIARDLTTPKTIGHWGNGDYECKIENEEDLNNVFPLIQQSYLFNK